MLLIAAGFSSCDKDDDIYPQLGDDPRNLSEVLSGTSELSDFYGALGTLETNVDSILSRTTTYTVFAPNNAALGSAGAGIDENLVLNHILSTVTADFTKNLTTGYRPTMATGPDGEFLDVFINTEGGVSLNGVASVVSGSSDVGTTNGVLHIIDGLLVPPTVTDHAGANPDFSMFAEAIELAGLAETLSTIDLENEAYPFTVFAPTNAAFEQLMAELNGAFGWSSLSDVPVETLQEILMYHVVTGTNSLAVSIPDTEQTSLQGEIFNIDVTSVISDASYATANILVSDIQGVNGVLHSINKVLLPEAVFQSLLAATLDLVDRSEDRGFTSFLAAAEKAGLTSDLRVEELTAFAPNDEAFTALFATISNFSSLDDFDTPEELEILRKLINYHLHEGILATSQLTDGGTISTLAGAAITADLSGDNPRLRSDFADAIPSTIVTPNIGATNAMIHELNRVLVPQELYSALGIETGEGGHCPVGDPALVFFDWDQNAPWWGNVAAENDPALSLDGSSYGRINMPSGGTGWVDLFWRNDASTFNGATVVGANIDQYSLKFDINVVEPITGGMFRIRFNNSGGEDIFYDWQPWNETGEPFTTDGWETIEIPLSVIGVEDYSQIDAEFGMAFEGANLLLNFAIDNVRFDTPGCGGPDPVANEEAVFFDWNGKDPWWGNVAVEDDAAISLDGTSYGRANFQTGSTGWVDLFWRNDASTFFGADMVGSNINDYVLKFDILTFEPIEAGMFRIRFNASGGTDAMYDWQPWTESGEPFDTEGEWVTVSIPASIIGQPDFSLVDAEFGMAFEGADVLLNFAIDNVRFEEK